MRNVKKVLFFTHYKVYSLSLKRESFRQFVVWTWTSAFWMKILLSHLNVPLLHHVWFFTIIKVINHLLKIPHTQKMNLPVNNKIQDPLGFLTQITSSCRLVHSYPILYMCVPYINNNYQKKSKCVISSISKKYI